jgi:glycolate oxidase FAD binding subunit
VIDHQPGDLVCTVSADVGLAELQAVLAEQGQMLALDPPQADAVTVGEVFDRALFGPRAHRYGLPRDLLLGIQAELPDGLVVRGGGRVVKNVAGYDLPKLFCGAGGRLGRLVELTVRLHPLPAATATLVCAPCDPAPLLPLAPACVEYAGGDGGDPRLLVRFECPVAGDLAEAARAVAGGEVVLDDESLWAQQRERQAGLHRHDCLPADAAATVGRLRGDGATAVLGRWARGWLFSDLEPPVQELSALEEAVIGAMIGV